MANRYCPTDLPTHDQVNCDNYFPGGITELIIFNSDANITDPSDETQINNELNAGNAFHVKDIHGEVPEPSEKTVNDPTDNSAVLLSFDRTISWQDWNVTQDNDNFYNELNKFRGQVLLYEVLNDGTGRVTWISDFVTFMAKRTVPQSDGEMQSWTVQGAWSAFDSPQIADIPTGIFGQ